MAKQTTLQKLSKRIDKEAADRAKENWEAKKELLLRFLESRGLSVTSAQIMLENADEAVPPECFIEEQKEQLINELFGKTKEEK